MGTLSKPAFYDWTALRESGRLDNYKNNHRLMHSQKSLITTVPRSTAC